MGSDVVVVRLEHLCLVVRRRYQLLSHFADLLRRKRGEEEQGLGGRVVRTEANRE